MPNLPTETIKQSSDSDDPTHRNTGKSPGVIKEQPSLSLTHPCHENVLILLTTKTNDTKWTPSPGLGEVRVVRYKGGEKKRGLKHTLAPCGYNTGAELESNDLHPIA